MKKFDLKSVSDEDIFVGDLWLIEGVCKNIIDEVKKANPKCDNLALVCLTNIAKEDAILIKVDENKYIDLDGIRNNRDIEIINELLNNGSKDNNIILSEGSLDPYIGELYIGHNTLKKINKDKILKKINTLK